MHFPSPFLFLLTFPSVAMSIRLPSNHQHCLNLWHKLNSLSSLDTCWHREEEELYSLRLQENIRLQHPENFRAAANPSNGLWTHYPICTRGTSSPKETTFCVYTSSSFAFGRGISFIGTPESVDLISQNPAFHTSASSHREHTNKHPPPYDVVQLPGRGYSLLANTTL
jgi:hypothetical protein